MEDQYNKDVYRKDTTFYYIKNGLTRKVWKFNHKVLDENQIYKFSFKVNE